MAKANAAPRIPSSYEMMGFRIMRLINSPQAQKSRQIRIEILPDESVKDWAQFVDEVSENEDVTVTAKTESSICLAWSAPTDTDI